MPDSPWTPQARRFAEQQQRKKFTRLALAMGLGANPAEAHRLLSRPPITLADIERTLRPEVALDEGFIRSHLAGLKAGMPAFFQKYFSTGVPTVYEDPNEYPVLAALFDEFVRIRPGVGGGVLLATLPSGDVNAAVRTDPRSGATIVFFERGLFSYLTDFALIIRLAFPPGELEHFADAHAVLARPLAHTMPPKASELFSTLLYFYVVKGTTVPDKSPYTRFPFNLTMALSVSLRADSRAVRGRTLGARRPLGRLHPGWIVEVSAGRPAALPEPGYQPPQRLFVSGSECRVRFFPEPTGPPRDFDFTELRVGRTLQVALARAFDAHVGPGGTVKATDSAANLFRVVKLFGEVMADSDPVPQGPGDLRSAMLDRFVVKRGGKKGLPFEVGQVKLVLRRLDGIDARFRNALVAPTTLVRDLGTRDASYTEAEERRILKAAREMLRQAAQRIRTNRDLLERWREEDPAVLADPRQEEYCRILDQVERTGELKSHSGQLLARWLRRHGTLEELMHAIHPRSFELAAGALLLVRLTGHNGSTICAAPAAHHRPDGYSGSTPTAVVELVKARRGPRRYMTVPLTDLPSWAPAPSPQVVLSGRDELHTAFGVYMLLLDITAPGRAITGTDRLMVSWKLKGGMGFRVGLRPSILDNGDWAVAAGLLDPAEPVDEGEDPEAGTPGERGQVLRPMQVAFGRMRKTHLQREQRPVAHTDKTLASEYLARDATAFNDYRKVVADALAAETAKARAVGRIAALSEQDLQEARQDPQAAARRHKVSIETLKRLITGEADTVLAGCTDNTAGPSDPAGQPCTASFLKCLECPCARALPHHLPVQTITLDALDTRRTQLTPLRWAQRFSRAHAQLTSLLDQAPDGAADRARSAATSADHRLVERLLARDLDHL